MGCLGLLQLVSDLCSPAEQSLLAEGIRHPGGRAACGHGHGAHSSARAPKREQTTPTHTHPHPTHTPRTRTRTAHAHTRTRTARRERGGRSTRNRTRHTSAPTGTRAHRRATVAPPHPHKATGQRALFTWVCRAVVWVSGWGRREVLKRANAGRSVVRCRKRRWWIAWFSRLSARVRWPARLLGLRPRA